MAESAPSSFAVARQAPTSSPTTRYVRRPARPRTRLGEVLSYGPAVGTRALRVDRRAPRDEARAGDGHQRIDGGRRFLFRHLVAEGDRVVIEQPTYDRKTPASARAGRRRADRGAARADGVDPAAIVAACATVRSHWPTSSRTSTTPPAAPCRVEKRKTLVQLAADHGFALFEDDPDRLISLDESRGETMLDMDRVDRVIDASSFSKSVSPGVRVGYLVGAGRSRSWRSSPSGPARRTRAEHAGRVDPRRACRSGELDENLKVVKLRSASGGTCRRGASRAHSGGGVRGAGRGYFLWLDLKDDVDKALLAVANEEGVTFVAGPTSCSRAAPRACASCSRLSRSPTSRRVFSDSPGPSSGSAPATPARRPPPRPGGPGSPGCACRDRDPRRGSGGLAPPLVSVGLDRPGDGDQPALGYVAVSDQSADSCFHICLSPVC